MELASLCFIGRTHVRLWILYLYSIKVVLNISEGTDVISAPPAKLIQSKMNSRWINDLNEQGRIGKIGETWDGQLHDLKLKIC